MKIVPMSMTLLGQEMWQKDFKNRIEQNINIEKEGKNNDLGNRKAYSAPLERKRCRGLT